MNVTAAAIVAVPATLLVMSQAVQGVSQAADALQRDPQDAATRIKKAELIIGGALVVAALLTGDTSAIVATTLAVGGTYFIYDRLVLKLLRPIQWWT